MTTEPVLTICNDFHRAVGAATSKSEIANAIKSALREAKRNKIDASDILPGLIDVTCSTNRDLTRRDGDESCGEPDTIASQNFFSAFTRLGQLQRASSRQ